MLRACVVVCLVFTAFVVEGRAAESLFALGDKATPEVVRREKARGLLRAWAFAGGHAATPFVLNEERDLERVQQALENVIAKAHGEGYDTTTTPLSVAAEHYLVWAMARAQMLNNVDYGETALQRFYENNKNKYPCEPSARVFELFVPDTYLESAGTTRILEEIGERVRGEEFGTVAVAYADRMGGGDLARLQTVTLKNAGAERSEAYKEAESSGGIGGPYPVSEGYLFVKIYGLARNSDDCFSFYREQVVEDYSREWLKKNYTDALSSATAELQADVRTFSEETDLSDVAFVVDGHTVNFRQAREMLPFLQGDQRDPRFWQSIQRQALEVELIYHSSLGKEIRDSREFNDLRGTLVALKQAHKTMELQVYDRTTSESVAAWFEENRDRFEKVSHVSYAVYSCEDDKSNQSASARCAGMLEKLRQAGSDSALFAIAVKNVVTSQSWDILPRETQAALQSLKVGEWSEVYMDNSRPKVVQLIERNVIGAVLNDYRAVAEEELLFQRQRNYFSKFFGVKLEN